jgi:hypothetical protein
VFGAFFLVVGYFYFFTAPVETTTLGGKMPTVI